MKQLFIIYTILLFFSIPSDVTCDFDSQVYLKELNKNKEFSMVKIKSFETLKLNKNNKGDILYFDLFICGYKLDLPLTILIKSNNKVLEKVYATKVTDYDYKLEVPVSVFFKNKMKRHKQFKIELLDTQEAKTWRRSEVLLDNVIIE